MLLFVVVVCRLFEAHPLHRAALSVKTLVFLFLYKTMARFNLGEQALSMTWPLSVIHAFGLRILIERELCAMHGAYSLGSLSK